MLCPWKNLSAAAAGFVVVTAMLLLSACKSSPKIKGLPKKLPDIQLSGRTTTPSHRMSQYDYPFDARGRYRTDWAANGERTAGRSAEATSADVASFESSHGGSATGKTPEPPPEPAPAPKPEPDRGRVVMKSTSRSSPARTSSYTPNPTPVPEPRPVAAVTPPPPKGTKPSPSPPPSPSSARPDSYPPPKKQVASSTSGSKPKSPAKPKPKGRSYTVKKGDTLSAIASRNSTTVAKIKAANGMSSDFLSIGKVLRIP